MHSIAFPVLSGLAALALVLGLIWLSARAARLTGLAPRAAAARRLSLAESLPIDQRRRLHLIRCDGCELLLTGGNSDAMIGWLIPPEHRP